MRPQLNLLQKPLKAANYCSGTFTSPKNVATANFMPITSIILTSYSTSNAVRQQLFCTFKALDGIEYAGCAYLIGRISFEQRRNFSSGQPSCTACGKFLRTLPTINIANGVRHCKDCNVLYSIKTPYSDMSGNRFHGTKGGERIERPPPIPREIANFLDKFVVGQEAAKKALATGVSQHYKRLANNEQFYRRIYDRDSALHHHSFNVALSHQTMHSMGHTEQYSADILNPVPKSTRLHSPSHTMITQIHPRKNPYSFHNYEDNPNILLEKSNIILLGPSGVGKTYITEMLAKTLDVPVALCDCTSMTQAGYVGEDVESVLQKLLQNAQGDLEKAERGIVFLDEIDKIAATRESLSHAYRDVSGEGVQHALLKMVEGTTVNVKSGRKGTQDVVQMNTKDILFIASGAFNGLERVVSKRLDKRSVGFGAGTSENTITDDDKEQQIINEKRDKLFRLADQGDLIKFGMIPELVGRFHLLVPFHSFDKKMLIRVLTEPHNSLLAQQKILFQMDGIALDFTEEALEEIANMAVERKVGARALRSIVEKVLLNPKFDTPGTDIETVRITRACIRGEASYEVTRREQQQQPTLVAQAV